MRVILEESGRLDPSFQRLVVGKMEFLFKVKYLVLGGPKGQLSALREDTISASGSTLTSPADLKGSIAPTQHLQGTAALSEKTKKNRRKSGFLWNPI